MSRDRILGLWLAAMANDGSGHMIVEIVGQATGEPRQIPCRVVRTGLTQDGSRRRCDAHNLLLAPAGPAERLEHK